MNHITKLVSIVGRNACTTRAIPSNVSAMKSTRQLAQNTPCYSFWGKSDSSSGSKGYSEDKKSSSNNRRNSQKLSKEEQEELDWQKEQDLKDQLRKEQNRKIRQKEAEKRLPNTIEELIQIGSPEAHSKIKNLFAELQEQKAKAKQVYQAENDEKLTALSVCVQWQEKAQEVKASLDRAVDDTEAMRLRLEKEKDLMKVFAITKFAGEILEVSDIIERAMEANKQHAGTQNDLYEGTLMTQKILDKILERNGVVKQNTEGEKFDPNFHDALCKVPDATKEPGTIAFVAQTGYKIHERVLRPAKVGVAIKP